MEGINRYIVIKSDWLFKCYYILEILKIKRLESWKISLYKLTCDIEIECIVRYKCFLSGEDIYTYYKDDISYEDILKNLVYSSDLFYECKEFIELSIVNKKYNV